MQLIFLTLLLLHQVDASVFEHLWDRSKTQVAMQLALSLFFLLAMQARQRQSWAVPRREVNKERSLLKSVRSCKRGNRINTLKAISISTQKL